MSSTYRRHPYFTEIPQKSYDACISDDDPKRLQRLLFALVVDPDEAEDAFSQWETTSRSIYIRRTGFDVQWFQSYGSAEVDRLLLTIRQWVLQAASVENALYEITIFDVRLGMWVACEVAKSCFIYRDLPDMRSLLTEAQGWATGAISNGRLQQILDESGPVQGQLPFEYAVLNIGPESLSIAVGGDDLWQAREAASVGRQLVVDSMAEGSPADGVRQAVVRSRDATLRPKAEAKVATRIASALLRFPR